MAENDGCRAKASDRLTELRDEEQKGLEVLAKAEAHVAELRGTLMRIGGAIQVLEEILEE